MSMHTKGANIFQNIPGTLLTEVYLLQIKLPIIHEGGGTHNVTNYAGHCY